MLYLKTLLIWFLIALTETIHGILRTKFLVPRVGDFRSRQIGVATGSLLIFVITLNTLKWLNPSNNSQALEIGIIWFVLMLIFEFVIGHYFFRFPWKWLLDEYNIIKGKLLLFGILFLLF